MTTPNRPARLQAALDALGDAFDALDPQARIVLATQAAAAGGTHSSGRPEVKEVWLQLHTLTEGATAEKLEHLVSVLEVAGPTLRQALVITARTAVDGDPPRSAVWRALVDVADAVVE